MKYILIGIISLVVLGFAYTTSSRPIVKLSTGSSMLSGERRPKRESDKIAVFAGGCFWSLESYFEKIPIGVVDVVSGYSGGSSENPTYENYAEGNHKEVVQVTYDPQLISYGELTEYFFRHIDPTDSGGSFYDRGENYTSVVFYEDSGEKKITEDIITTINNEKIFEKPIVTDVLLASSFWPAEEYHQNYAKKNSLGYAAYRAGSGRDAFLKKTWEGRKSVIYIEKKRE